jgi:hypothetical protein
MDAPPRYRIEHRHPEWATLIVGFANARPEGISALWRAAWQLGRAGETGAVVLVDQETERDVEAREIGRRLAV